MNDENQINMFDEIIEDFSTHVISISTTLPLVKGFVEIIRKNTLAEHNGFLDKYGELSSTEGEKKSYNLPPEYISKYIELNNQWKAIDIANLTIPRSYLILLVSQFDIHLGKLIRSMFLSKPEMLNSSQKSMGFADISKFATIEDAKEYIIEKEIESILRQSHTEQFKWLENKLGIPLRKDLNIWADFIELTERRNLLVHNDGIVSNQYIDVCTENGALLNESIKLGTKLTVPPDYFQNSYRVVYEMGTKLGHVMWRKLHPDQSEQADRSLNNLGYKLISNREFSLAIELLRFGANDIKKHASEEMRVMMIVNIAQAQKWSGANDYCLKTLETIDWSALASKFKMAYCVLKDDFNKAAELMITIGISGEIQKHEYKDWPLFSKFRETDEFKKAYQAVFGEAFNPPKFSSTNINIRFINSSEEHIE